MKLIRAMVAAAAVFPLVAGIIILSPVSQVLAAEGGGRAIELILDASGSMNGRLPSGETKLAAAKKAVEKLVPRIPGEDVLAFRAYGHQSHRSKKDCQDTQLLVGFGPAAETGKEAIKIAGPLRARGYTPITNVLILAAGDLTSRDEGEKVIILVSDGKETCQGDPCTAARELVRGGKIKLVIHTVGFGVDEATRAQLECIARVTGGRYFPAADSQELASVLKAAVETKRVEVKPEKGSGKLEIKGADLMGHQVINAVTGKNVAELSQVQSVVDLPAGIYNVTIGKAVWKSVEVRPGQKTVLIPGWMTVKGASVKGHQVVEAETGLVHAVLSNTKNSAALMPGEYEVLFGPLAWPNKIKAGQELILRPGTITVKGAEITGHKVRDKTGQVVGSVSATMNWLPLPPGEYSVEIKGQERKFTLVEGQEVQF